MATTDDCRLDWDDNEAQWETLKWRQSRDDVVRGQDESMSAAGQGQRMTRNRSRPHFEWTPGGPLPENLSRLAEQVADLVLEIPPGRWVSWGDLGDALGTTGKAVAEVGLTLDPTPGETLMPPQC